MKTTGLSSMGTSLASVILGVLATLLVIGVWSGRKVPFISGERAALIVLVVIGMAMCARGIGYVAANGLWTHPISILGYLVGALILIIAGAALVSIPLPLISTTRQAVLAIGLLSAAKLAFSALHRWLL
jgi:hypothetical protein